MSEAIEQPSETSVHPASKFDIKSIFARLGRWTTKTWSTIRPGPEARKGAIWTALATVVWGVLVAAWNLKSGFGLWADLLFAILVVTLGIPVFALVVALVLSILRPLPKLLTGFFAAAFLLLAMLWYGSAGYWIAAIILLVECCLGAAGGTILLGGLRRAGIAKRILTWMLLTLAVAANVYLVRLFRSDGIDEELIRIHQNAASLPPLVTAPNPADPGPYQVKTLFYGSGNDLRRPEYGHSVAIRTTPVDAALFFKDFGGWKARLRKFYWGFGMDKLPLNARVWYPDGAGPFPLVLIVHGNHNMSEFSDPGYAYLGELLASRGFITASIDENFLNDGLFHEPHKQQAVRGWLLLEHLRLWHTWNSAAGNPFSAKVDVNNIALMGHSRGGEAAATAALFNQLDYYPEDANIRFHYRYAIKSVVAIAPADGQYKPADRWRVLQDINYLTLQGSNDADVSTFMGSRQWDHVHFTGKQPAFKSELYIYRANHGQFNTVWGRADASAPSSWLLNLRPLLKGEQQRQIAKVYISGFLEATLHNRTEYLAGFHDYRRIRNWLPDTLYANRYADASGRAICTFEEDADLTTTTIPGGHISTSGLAVWHEGKIPFRSGDRDYNGVFLGWKRQIAGKSAHPAAPNYSIQLPPNFAGANLDGHSELTLSVAVSEDDDSDINAGDEPATTDFTIEASTQEGITAKIPISCFGTLLPPLRVQFTKLEKLDRILDKEPAEPVFQTIAVPLSAFAAQDPRFNPAHLTDLRLIFDKSAPRQLIISGIGFQRMQ